MSDKNTTNGKRKVNKTLWWSLLWANIVMLVVLLLTFLFQRYLYAQMTAHLVVDVDINLFYIAIGYVVGLLLMWAVVYKLLKDEPTQSQNSSQNHNIY
ncbi:MAG: hypothetical protein IJ433_07775 [Ruminococcus sp.]|nr:hypothetical protein [Ruminococcus sp.]